MSLNDSSARHVVTAVIVAHDGAAWLPRLIAALTEQTRPVQRVVAVDTGSRDRSGSLLTASLGQGAVFGMDRSTGYAAAVRRAVAHKAATAPVPAMAVAGRDRDTGSDSGQPAEWLWLLHDDCEPAPDALEQLLRGAQETPAAAVLGPKLMDWADRRVIAEAGLALDTAGRRITNVEPREVDQGQHDGDRDVLAVCSAGMLVRRDVWEKSGGFDPAMTLFGEDIDFCWRVHQAGYRVRVITDAVIYHAAAAARGRRAVSVGRRARLLQRRNGLLTLLANLPPAPMIVALAGNLTLSLLRVLFYLFAKRPTAALDETAAVLGAAGHPLRLARIRRTRSRGRRAAYSTLRSDLPPGGSLRRAAEFAASLAGRASGDDLAGAHHATDDPDDDESLLTDSGVVRRVLTRPGVLLALALIAITIAAERSVIGRGTLGGGALVPAWSGASGLWAQFLQAYHPAGVGSTSVGPPYVGLVALLSTILLGKVWLAIDVLLLGCVPLAGISAFLALRRVTLAAPVRVWAAAAYALLPIAFGAIAAGRLGSAVAFVTIPLIAMFAGRMLTGSGKPARRAAWAAGLAVTVGTAFVPLVWPLAVAAALIAAVVLGRAGRSLLANLAIAVLTPLVLLLPWLVPLLKHPALLLLEAGLSQPGLASPRLPARSLLLLSPGGPGLPPSWVSAALLATGLAALIASRRRALIASGWIVALLGFAAAVLASRTAVTPAAGQPVTAWPGIALAVSAAGLLLAAAAGADGLGRWLSAGGRAGARRALSVRALPVAVVALVAAAGPVVAAAFWLVNGISGPLRPQAGPVVPSLVSTTGGAGRQVRTLVLTPGSRGTVSFLLLRGGSPQFSAPDLSPAPAAEAALTTAVSALVAPGGGEAVQQSRQLTAFDIGFVLLRLPADAGIVSALNGVSGLTEVSRTPTFDLWRLAEPPSRVSVVEPAGTVVAVGSGPVGVSGAAAPAAGGTLLLSEPAGGWTARLNGHALKPVASPAARWAQAFRLPPGGGTLTISRDSLVHNLVMALELVLFVVVAALALPGIRSRAELDTAAAGTSASIETAGAGGGDAEPEAIGQPEAAGESPRHQGGNARSGGESASPDAGAGRPASQHAGAQNAASLAAGGLAGTADDLAGTGHGLGGAGRRGRTDGRDEPEGRAASGGHGRGRRAGGLSRRRGAASRGRKAAAATDVTEADRNETAAAAWPAGQQVSRFVSGPPESAAGLEETTAIPAVEPRPTPAGEPGRHGPRGRLDDARRDPVSGEFGQPGRYSGEFGQPGQRSGEFGQPGRYSGEYRGPDRAHDDAAAWSGQTGQVPPPAWTAGQPLAPGYRDDPLDRGRAGDPGSLARDDSPGDRGPAGYGQERYQEPGYESAGTSTGWQPDDQTSAWPAAAGHGESAWPATGEQYPPRAGEHDQSAWPGSDQQPGWPDGRSPGRAHGEPRWHVPGQQPWPDQDDAPDGPPSGEVHHDWDARDSRTSQGWGIPARDEEGEQW